MSTKETDLYWERQGVIYQEFCDYVDSMTGVDPKTYRKCQDYLEVVEDEVDEEEEKEREAERADMHFAPSEGFNN